MRFPLCDVGARQSPRNCGGIAARSPIPLTPASPSPAIAASAPHPVQGGSPACLLRPESARPADEIEKVEAMRRRLMPAGLLDDRK